MLVLTRKKNEKIIINDNIELTIIDVKGEQVKIGIKAPRNVSVHRGEIYNEIKLQNEQAASTIEALSKASSLLQKQKDETE